ncbi:nucleotidyltransferase domain-containing protein [Amycolatopsis sp. NPDC051373]|uniref:DNA polymerase beta superfamily protein n=1 Tax=Amycolatopsis sp. NPDC051373 TaxID=3155801 RepID=UPI00344C6D1B
MEWSPVLGGVVGSTAYGLAGPESDVDRLVFAAAPTVAFHGFSMPVGRRASRVSTSPDVTVHEVGKALHLVLQANPTVSELLWLDEYEHQTELGRELVAIRGQLIGAHAARDAYLGYAVSQFKRLKLRGESFSSATAGRTGKHARHLMRLCTQIRDLWWSGTLSVRVDNPERFHAFGRVMEDDPEQGVAMAESMLSMTSMALDSRTPALPMEPNVALAEDWLIRVRAHYFREAA